MLRRDAPHAPGRKNAVRPALFSRIEGSGPPEERGIVIEESMQSAR
jgi:hypothetical protein